MVRPSHLLGINARNQLYTSQNTWASKRFGFSKVKTKLFLQKHGIGVAKLHAVIKTREELSTFSWETIKGSFVIKPVDGSEGKGIVVIAGTSKKHKGWLDLEGEIWTKTDFQRHGNDILDGVYSTWGSNHMVVVEERIPLHPDLERYVQMGTPDVRVIIFNRIPVMAYIRLPTKESKGRANLHRGAIALGIDLGTGETTHAVSGMNTIIRKFPHIEDPISGIKIPYWVDILKTAVRAANACDYTYVAADIFIHPEKGPMVAEMNGFPGLSIQLANRAGLKRRLQRVEEIVPRNVSHAVRIGQALFAENYVVSGSDVGELVIVEPKTNVMVYDDHDKAHEFGGLVNTGRFRSAIARDVAKSLGLLDESDLLWNQEIEGEGKVPVIEVKFKLKDKVLTTTMLVTKKLESKTTAIEVGRRDLRGFLVGDT